MQSELFPDSLFTVKTFHKPLLQPTSRNGDPSKSRCVIVSKSESRALEELLNHYPFDVPLLIGLHRALRIQMDHHYLKSQSTSPSHVDTAYRLSVNPIYGHRVVETSGPHEPPETTFSCFTRSLIASRLNTVFENFYQSQGYFVPHVPTNLEERYHFIAARRYTFELLALTHNVDGVFFFLKAFPRFYRDSWTPFLLRPNGFVTIYCVASASLSRPILNLCHRCWRGSREDLDAVFFALHFHDNRDIYEILFETCKQDSECQTLLSVATANRRASVLNLMFDFGVLPCSDFPVTEALRLVMRDPRCTWRRIIWLVQLGAQVGASVCFWGVPLLVIAATRKELREVQLLMDARCAVDTETGSLDTQVTEDGDARAHLHLSSVYLERFELSHT